MSDNDVANGPEGGEIFPSVDVLSPDDFVIEQGTVEPIDGIDLGTATDLGWEFCLRFDGRPWQTVAFQVDTAAEAAGWAQAYTQYLNRALIKAGYPPACTWTAGAC
jgi:hypothetical protein